MPGFETLQLHYRDRLAAARQAPRGVVGIVGNTVPRELVLAADRLPVLIGASLGGPTPVADCYMEPVIAPERNAIVRPPCRLLRAASAVRTLARTEMFIPMKPAAPERSEPSTKPAA